MEGKSCFPSVHTLISLQRSSPNEMMEQSAPAAGDSARRIDAVATRSVVLLAGPGAARQRRDQRPSRDEESPLELTGLFCRYLQSGASLWAEIPSEIKMDSAPALACAAMLTRRQQSWGSLRLFYIMKEHKHLHKCPSN